MAPPPVPSIHRRLNSNGNSSSASREPHSSALPRHVSNPNNIMNIDTPHHLQRRPSASSSTRTSSQRQRSNANATASSKLKRPPCSHSINNDNTSIAAKSSSSRNTTKQRTMPRYKSNNNYQRYTFQHPRHDMSVTLHHRHHRSSSNNNQHTSFLTPPHPSSAALASLLNDMERSRGSRLTTQSLVSEMNSTSSSTTNNNNSSSSSNPCRISPSPGGMRIWEIRNAILKNSGSSGQLRWRGVNGCEYPWFDPLVSTDTDSTVNDEKDDDDDAVMNSDASVRQHKSKHQIKKSTTTTTKSIKKNHHQYTQYSHLYTPINPYTNTVSKLPAHSPLFTHYKRRLPNRADVGFGNPSETDVRRKMSEVSRECEWQECSPRIVCLTSGFFIGCSSSTTEPEDNSNDDTTVIHNSCRHEMEAWYGGRIPGIPFAGRDLIDCYKMYRRFEEEYNSNSNGNNNNSCTSSNNKQTTILQQQHSRKERDRIKDPRTHSIFAPPIDATPSKSNVLWKERPFNDRPPGMRYVLACPSDLRQEEDDDEPLFCSMALYLLPRREENGGTTSTISPNINNNTIKFRGKISEEFHFPAGNWNAIEGGHSEEQSWRRRKRRAVFSYDPLDCELEDLFLVVQVFRVARGGGIGTDGVVGDGNDGKRKGLGNKLKGTFKKSKSRTDIADDLPNSKSSVRMIDPSIGEYGPKFLTPVCFTVMPALSITENSADIQYWPAGETVHAPFYAYPDGSVTQEDFMDLLSTLSESQRTEYSSTTNDNIRSYATITKIKKLIPMA
eukprot:scaffold24127_cov22-Cyclotella_meneghiniana.AAC.1